MPAVNEEVNTFTWLDEAKISHRRRTKERHYWAFQHGDLQVKCGDYVLIRNDESLNPEDLRYCFIAQVKDLLDKGNDQRDPYQAIVQWYSRIADIPLKHRQFLKDADSEQELIQEVRGWATFVDAETIFGKCMVLLLPQYVPEDLYVNNIDNNGEPVFYCKWQYDGSTFNSVCASSSNLNPALQKFVVPCEENGEVKNGTRHSSRSSSRMTDGCKEPFVEVELIGTLIRNSRRKHNSVQETKHRQVRDVADFAPTNVSETPVKKIQKTKYGREVRSPKVFYVAWKDDVESEYGLELNGVHHSVVTCDKEVNGFPSDSEDSYVPSDENDETPVESDSDYDGKYEKPSKIRKRAFRKTLIGNKLKKPAKKRKFHSHENKSSLTVDALSLLVPSREGSLMRPKNSLEEAREKLHASVIPDILSCREHEYSDIYTFVKGKLLDETGGCMYISGVPGTGKTATVLSVVRNLKKEEEKGEVPGFKFIEINGMRMTEPHQCYVQILKALTGQKAKAESASEYLQEYFISKACRKEAVLIMIDELDLLWTRKQTVMYSLFDWPSHSKSKLVIVAIANTMDLPERMMKNRIISRLGLTRMAFQPYSFKQLQEIVFSRMERMEFPDPFDPDAVQLAARKVAAVSGDARRLLDICRRSTEIAEEGTVKLRLKKGHKYLVGIAHVEKALQEMFSSPMIMAIRAASLHDKIFLKSVVAEFQRTGVEETVFASVYKQHVAYCRFEGIVPPSVAEVIQICVRLGRLRILLLENNYCDIDKRIQLNITTDDVLYALEELRKM